MTKNEVIAQLKKDNPVLREGSEEQGYTELTPAEYDARIAEWADNILAKKQLKLPKQPQRQRKPLCYKSWALPKKKQNCFLYNA